MDYFKFYFKLVLSDSRSIFLFEHVEERSRNRCCNKNFVIRLKIKSLGEIKGVFFLLFFIKEWLRHRSHLQPGSNIDNCFGKVLTRSLMNLTMSNPIHFYPYRSHPKDSQVFVSFSRRIYERERERHVEWIRRSSPLFFSGGTFGVVVVVLEFHQNHADTSDPRRVCN